MDSATLTALAQPGLVLRHFVYLIALSGDEFGFWEGIDDVTVSVPAARTGVSTSRDYLGGMAFDAVPNAVYSGDIKQQYSIAFDLTHVAAETMVRGYN